MLDQNSKWLILIQMTGWSVAEDLVGTTTISMNSLLRW